MSVNNNYNNSELNLFEHFKPKEKIISSNLDKTTANTPIDNTPKSKDNSTFDDKSTGTADNNSIIFNTKSFSKYAIDNFSFLDTNNDGFILEKELIINKSNTKDQYTFNVAKNKLDLFSDILDPDSNGISKKELTNLYKGNGFDLNSIRDIGALPLDQTFLSSEKIDMTLPKGFDYNLSKVGQPTIHQFDKGKYSQSEGGVVSDGKFNIKTQEYILSINGNEIPIFMPILTKYTVNEVDIENFSKSISSLPDFLIREIKKIEFNPYEININYLNNQTKEESNTKIDMTSGNGTVTVYPIGARKNVETYKTLIHEIGHNITNRLWDNTYENNPKWNNWNNAMKKDSITASEYAITNPLEDFSEAFTMYITAKDDTHKEELTKLMPNRFEIIDNIVSLLKNKNSNYNKSTQVNLRHTDNNIKPNEKVKKTISFDDIFNTSY